MKRRIPIILAGVAVAVAGFTIPATSALAANCPTTGVTPVGPTGSGNPANDGGTCQVPGTISTTVNSQLAIATDLAPFALTAVSTSAETPAGNIFVLSNDGSGYTVDFESSAYTSPLTSIPIPASDVSGFSQTQGTNVSLGSAQSYIASGGVSGQMTGTPPPDIPGQGWDWYSTAGQFFLNAMPTLPAGVYTGANAFAGTVSYTLWGN